MKQLKITVSISVFLISTLMLILFVSGCSKSDSHKNGKPVVSSNPKTSFGQAIKKAQDLDQTAKDRNAELEDQAEEIER